MNFPGLLILILLASPALAQDPVPPPHQAPHTRIQLMSDELQKLGNTTLISSTHVAELNWPLEDAIAALQKATPTVAMQRLEVFNHKVRAQVPANVRDALLTQSTDIQNQVADTGVAGLSRRLDYDRQAYSPDRSRRKGIDTRPYCKQRSLFG
jgi:hypothetical protein